MNIEEAYRIYVAAENFMSDDLSEAIDRIIDYKANQILEVKEVLDKVELAEFKARIQIEEMVELHHQMEVENILLRKKLANQSLQLQQDEVCIKNMKERIHRIGSLSTARRKEIDRLKSLGDTNE